MMFRCFLLQTVVTMLTLGGKHQVKYSSEYLQYVCIHILGSMPPDSQYLWEEGMCVKSFKLVENGIFQEEGWLYIKYTNHA